MVARLPIKYTGMKGVFTKGMAAARKRVEYTNKIR
jgi:hypothetical protein